MLLDSSRVAGEKRCARRFFSEGGVHVPDGERGFDGLLAETASLPAREGGDEATLGAQDAGTRTVFHSPAASVGRYFGRYELLAEIARGGMGVVFKARQQGLNRIVALKMILSGELASADDVKRFRAEAEAAAQLDHPGIVPVFEVGEHDGQHYFSMGFVEGPSLADRLRDGPLPARDAADLVARVCDAVQYAHEQGVVHRDLKPGNILLSADQPLVTDDKAGGVAASPPAIAQPGRLRPRLTDFGLAKRVQGGSQLTASGQVLGTPSYMPPEQASGSRGEIGPASDVYALGAVLYALLTGRPPFAADNPVDTIMQVLDREPVAPRQLNAGVPRDLETIALKCLEKSPSRRYASAREVGEELRSFLAGTPIRARPTSQLERGWRWCRRNRGKSALLAAALVLLSVVLAGGYWFNRRLEQQLHQTEAAQRRLQSTLTREAALRMDSDLRQLASIPQLMAATLARRSDWTERQLEDWIRQSVQTDPRVFGVCVAFEPYQFEAGSEDFALYVSRAAADLQTKRLTAQNYRPNYRKWDWYRRPVRQRRASWSEPFLDEGGGNVPMLTYSVPLERQGKVVGVVTADLSLDYFRVLRSWMAELSPDGYAFVVCPTGVFISHPHPSCRMPKSIAHLARSEAPSSEAAGLRALSGLLLGGKAGRVEMIDPWTGRLSQFLFAPVPSTGWMLTVVSPLTAGDRSSSLQPVRQTLQSASDANHQPDAKAREAFAWAPCQFPCLRCGLVCDRLSLLRPVQQADRSLDSLQ